MPYYQGYPNYQYQQNYQQNYQNQIIPIPSEMDARNYPVANGNSVTFRDENKPYIYVKSMGYSQLDRPIFEKYRLTKEETEEQPTQAKEYALKTDIQALYDEINKLKGMIEEVKDNEYSSDVSTIKE